MKRTKHPRTAPPPPLSFPVSSLQERLPYRNLRFLLLLFLLTLGIRASSQSPLVYRLELRDTIQPITAARLDRAIALANHDHAAAVLIELDTPGGLLDSTRQMVGALLNSPTPVIVYIAPAGARAGSAGFFLLEAADIAAMAPGTNAGAAHPVLSSGVPDETMKMKMENDAAAFLRSYVVPKGRNAEVAEQAVRSSKSFSADEALALHLTDLTAATESQLLDSIEGKTIRTGSASLALHVKNARVLTVEPTIREQILSAIANPNLALLLLVAGVLLIYLEFNVPGTIVPGALGTVLALLGIFALNLFPIRYTAILLLLAAVAFFILEIKFTSHGVLAIAGIACLTFGTLTLIDAPIPELAIHPGTAIGLAVGFGLITAVLMTLAMRAKRQKSLIGPAALVGFPAKSMEALWPEYDADAHSIGRILVQGEIWQATASEPLPEQATVRVTGFHGDVLEVRPEAATTSIPEPRYSGN